MRQIPRIIHKIFFTSDDALPPPHIDAAINTWTDMNPNFELQLYDIRRARKFIKEHSPKSLRAFDMLEPYAYKADLFRYILLYTQGGVYSDIRQACLVPLDSVFAADMTWFSSVDHGKGQNGRGMCNATLISVQKHAYMEEAIDRCVENIEAMDYSQGRLGITGPKLLGQCIRLRVGMHKGGVHIGKYARNHVTTAQGVKFVMNRMGSEEGNKKWSDVNTGNSYNQMFAKRHVFKDDFRMHFNLSHRIHLSALTPFTRAYVALVVTLSLALVLVIRRYRYD